MLHRGRASGRGLIRKCVCAIMWAAWRTSVPVSTPSKARAVGRRARERAPPHADEVRRWPQKPAGGARCHGHGRDELAGCRPSRWAYWTDGCVGPAAQRSGRPAGAVGGGRHPDEENGRAGRGDIHTNAGLLFSSYCTTRCASPVACVVLCRLSTNRHTSYAARRELLLNVFIDVHGAVAHAGEP